MLSYTLKKDGPFHILQITDLHLTHGWHYDEKTLAMVKDLTEFAKPDLIVMTGDVITDGEGFHPDVMEHACREFDALGVPWAFVMGNHEGNYNFGKGMREKKGEFLLAHSKNVLFDRLRRHLRCGQLHSRHPGRKWQASLGFVHDRLQQPGLLHR